MHQPTTGTPCACRPGIARDNCPQCEGTGARIDFAAIRARPLQHKKKKPRIFALQPDGEVRPSPTHGSATVEAANATEARALFLRFAYRAAEEPPKVRATPRAYQLAHHTPYGLRVEAGPLTRTDSKGFLFSACIAGSYDDQRPENVKVEAASFAYYDSPEYNQEG